MFDLAIAEDFMISGNSLSGQLTDEFQYSNRLKNIIIRNNDFSGDLNEIMSGLGGIVGMYTFLLTMISNDSALTCCIWWWLQTTFGRKTINLVDLSTLWWWKSLADFDSCCWMAMIPSVERCLLNSAWRPILVRKDRIKHGSGV